jgi:hypothetical protein
MVEINFLTKVQNSNGSMAIKIYNEDVLLYEQDNFITGPGQINFKTNWPSVITIYSSNKNNDDTIFNDKGEVTTDKSVEITGILINGFAVHIDMIDKLFHCLRNGDNTITHENYWGFNGCTKIYFTEDSPMKFMLKLGNQFDVNRLEWQDGKK